MAKVRLAPILDRVIILEDRNPKETSGGIIIPNNIKKEYGTGKIVGKGGLVLEAEAGRQCAFNPDLATTIVVDGVEYVIIREREIYGVYR